MPFHFTVSAAALRDLRPFASTEESRPILNGILVESTGAMCATNGHVMLARAPEHPDTMRPPIRDVVVRLSKAVPKWAEFADISDVPDVPSVSFQDAPLVVKVWNAKGKVDYIPASEVAGPFPNWRAVMPRNASAGAPLPPVDPRSLERFAVEGCQAVRFFADASATRAVLVAFDGRPEYVGILMPTVSNAWTAGEVPPLPGFTDTPQAPAAEQAA